MSPWFSTCGAFVAIWLLKATKWTVRYYLQSMHGHLLCVLISSKFWSISSCMSTYSGGRWRPLSSIVPLLVNYYPELFRSFPLSSSEDALVEEGSKVPLSFVIDASGDLNDANPVFFTWNLSDKDKTIGKRMSNWQQSREVKSLRFGRCLRDSKSIFCSLQCVPGLRIQTDMWLAFIWV